MTTTKRNGATAPTPAHGKWVNLGTKEAKRWGIAVMASHGDQTGAEVIVTNRFGHVAKVTLGAKVGAKTESISGIGAVEFYRYEIAETPSV